MPTDSKIRPFASKIGIVYSRKLSKSDLADAIANKRIELESNVASGTDPDILFVEDSKSPPLKNKILLSKTQPTPFPALFRFF